MQSDGKNLRTDACVESKDVDSLALYCESTCVVVQLGGSLH